MKMEILSVVKGKDEWDDKVGGGKESLFQYHVELLEQPLSPVNIFNPYPCVVWNQAQENVYLDTANVCLAV